MSTGKKVVFAVATTCVVAAAVAGIAYFSYQKNLDNMKQVVEVDTIYPGITIEGIDVGGLTIDGANTMVKQELQKTLEAKKITLQDGEQSWEIPYTSFHAGYAIDEAVQQAYDIARTGQLKQRYEQIKELQNQSDADIEVAYSFDQAQIRSALEQIAPQIDKEPLDSVMTRKNGSFSITEEQKGRKLDVEKTAQKVIDLAQKEEEGIVEAVVEQVEPSVTKQMNEQATTLIGGFHTTFSTSSSMAGRNENLRVGCLNINGTVVAPGEIFSMNKELGPQTYENGYRNAAVIVNGKLEDGLAGGVCQITTTLYNAVIFAELEVVERRNHSLAVGYVPLGRDAAIAGDYTDFKFRNDTDYPVYVEAYLDGGKLVCNVYGHEVHDAGREVEFEKVFVATVPKPPEKVTKDPELPEGTREVTYTGKTGSKVSTYKKVYQNGELISREWFSDSNYRATADEVTVGTKKVETPSVAAAPQEQTQDGVQPPQNNETPPPVIPEEQEQSSDMEPIGA